MKYSKQQSLSTDTRLSRSGIFNNSSLNASLLPPEAPPAHSHTNLYMSSHIQNCQAKQVQFLRTKNAQLEETNRRLVASVRELETSKSEILAINSKYVDVVNRYYEESNARLDKDRAAGARRHKDSLNMSFSEAHRTLEQLEKDHRNLVKHCLAMQEQIKNYTKEMEKFKLMKAQLASVNHTEVKDLIQEIEDLCEENKHLRKTNNQISYELEKEKEECKKVKRVHGAKEKEAGDSSAEIAKMHSLINTTLQESTDKSNAYQARIYDLELKVQKLEKQLRESQQSVAKTKGLHRQLELKQVQQVHQYRRLQNSVSDLLRSRERATSHYSRSKNPNKNLLDLTLNANQQRNRTTNISIASFGNAKNQRRSLAEKSNIII